MSSETRIMLKKVRLAFPVLNEPEKFRGSEGKPRYSASLLIEPGSENDLAVKAAIKAAAAEHWGPDKAAAAIKAIGENNKLCYVNGDRKPDYDGFPGNWVLRANAQENKPPVLLDGHRKELPRNTNVIYAGCYVNAAVEIWTLDKSAGFGNQINCQLRGVQFAGDGDAFGGGAPAKPDEFEVVEGIHDMTSDEFADDVPFA